MSKKTSTLPPVAAAVPAKGGSYTRNKETGELIPGNAKKIGEVKPVDAKATESNPK